MVFIRYALQDLPTGRHRWIENHVEAEQPLEETDLTSGR